MKSYSLHTPIGKVRLVWQAPGCVAEILLPSAATAHDRCRGIPPGWLAGFVRQLRDYFAGKPVEFDLTVLDLSGATDFQQRVRTVVAAIPPGETMSYAAVAAAAGSPGAARAVGTVMSGNPFPLAIPCHRVIAANGKLGGFGGGLDMKRWLLDHEGRS